MMMNMIVTEKEGGRMGVLSLREAYKERLMDSPDIYPDPAYYRHKQITTELSKAAPNLALNVKNATATSWELWLWALLWIVLQLTAMATPGVLLLEVGKGG